MLVTTTYANTTITATVTTIVTEEMKITTTFTTVEEEKPYRFFHVSNFPTYVLSY